MSDPRVDEAMASGQVPGEHAREKLELNQDLVGIVSIVLVTSFTSIIVIGRLLSRRFIVKQFGLGLDDGFALASLLVAIPFSALCIHLINLGAARTPLFVDFAIDDSTFGNQQIIDSVAHLVYCTALVLCRISGLAFYYRICALHTEFLIAIRVIFGILVAGYLAQMFLVVFHCWPVTLLWAPIGPAAAFDSVCIFWDATYGSVSAISLACDLLLFGLPVAMLKILDMPQKQKLQLACILLPGIGVIGLSGSRIAFVIAFGDEKKENFSFAFLRLLIIEVSEICATLIALSIPGVKPLVDKFILRKDVSRGFSELRNSSNRSSIGFHSSSLKDLKGRSHFSMLDD